tara:strand:- start:287 stop:625 length:339 start_codon:yes stop_codon:yes gene_type:complete
MDDEAEDGDGSETTGDEGDGGSGRSDDSDFVASDASDDGADDPSAYWRLDNARRDNEAPTPLLERSFNNAVFWMTRGKSPASTVAARIAAGAYDSYTAIETQHRGIAHVHLL